MGKKKRVLFALICFLAFGSIAMAQDSGSINPLIREGVKEVGVVGIIDLEGPQGSIDADISASYGYFMNRNLEVGGFATYSRANNGDVLNYTLGAFAEYHLHANSMVGFAQTVPYVGASLGLSFLDTDLPGQEDQSGLTFIPRVGVKWFFRDYVAVDTNFYFAFASDDIYVNDGNTESYDFGINLGLRVYFE